jgi:hypothetical protein
MGHSAGANAKPNSARAAEAPSASLISGIARLVDGARALLRSQLQLFALETRRAAKALGLMAALGVAVGILLAGTWLAVSAACALWLMEQGVRPSVALLASSLLGPIGILALWVAMHKTSHALTFPASFQSWPSGKNGDGGPREGG